VIKWNLEFMRHYFAGKAEYLAATGERVNFEKCFADNCDVVAERSAHIRYLWALAK